MKSIKAVDYSYMHNHYRFHPLEMREREREKRDLNFRKNNLFYNLHYILEWFMNLLCCYWLLVTFTVYSANYKVGSAIAENGAPLYARIPRVAVLNTVFCLLPLIKITSSSSGFLKELNSKPLRSVTQCPTAPGQNKLDVINWNIKRNA